MSVLQKKMQVKNSTPAAFQLLPKEFNGLYKQLALVLADTLSRDIDCPSSRAGVAMSLCANFDACKTDISGMVFALGKLQDSEDREDRAVCESLIEVSTPLARLIIDAKLGGKARSPDEMKRPLSLLDVLLAQPIANFIGTEVQTMIGSTEQLGVLDRGVSLEEMNKVSIAKQDPWLKFEFPVSVKQEAPKEQSKQKTKTGSSSADALSVTIYVTPAIAHKIAAQAQENQAHVNVNPGSPWSVHMRDTMLAATRPLEIVLEDLKLSIADCTRLSLGQILRLPGASHERLKVKTPGNAGKITLTTATLGAFKTSKAVKLNADIDPEFFASP